MHTDKDYYHLDTNDDYYRFKSNHKSNYKVSLPVSYCLPDDDYCHLKSNQKVSFLKSDDIDSIKLSTDISDFNFPNTDFLHQSFTDIFPDYKVSFIIVYFTYRSAIISI